MPDSASASPKRIVKQNRKEVKNVADTVWELAQPIAESLGFSVWDVEFRREGSEWVLRITLDSQSGISLDDCEAFQHAIDAPLDEADPIETSYSLEVSSPGIERSLKYPWHFERFLGSRIQAKCYAPIPEAGGVKQFLCTLEKYDPEEDALTLALPGGAEITLPRDRIASTRVAFDFEGEAHPKQ